MFKLRLTNFRSFKDQEFDFSKFNILIGENSSGKSSIFKFLLALKQTIRTPNNREINLAFTGEYADLGNYRESVYYHDETLPMSFCFGFDNSYYDFYMNDFSDESEASLGKSENLNKLLGGPITNTTYVTFTITKELDDHSSIITTIYNENLGRLTIEHIKQIDSNEKQLIFGSSCKIIFNDKITNTEYIFDKVEYDKDGFMSLVKAPSLLENIEKILGKINYSPFEIDMAATVADESFPTISLFHRVAYLLVTQNYVKYILDKIDYVNPINTNPARFYVNKDKRSIMTINNIEDVVEFFSKSNDLSKSALIDFIEILKHLELADEIDIIKDDRLPVREIRVKVKDLLSNIKDVGYGVSLQMPIILKALLADNTNYKKNTLLLIEQPEVHLHPKLHAKLIEALVRMSQQSIYFIETHSEHIVRKLQVLVKEKDTILKEEDVTIHYLRRLERKTEVTKHKIDKNGLLKPSFPSGFFDASYILAKELLD